jgi:hypothetical protein
MMIFIGAIVGISLGYFSFKYVSKEKLRMCREIYKYLSWANLVDFIVFNARSFAARKLETGLLVKKQDIYEITFFDGPLKYKIRFKKVRGPSKICKILDSDINDVTEVIRCYAGPSHDFYKIPTTPGMLGYDGLIFHTILGRKYEFDKDEIIVFDK